MMRFQAPSIIYVPPPANEYFDYAVVIDFEATCEHHSSVDYVHEIIQFPAILIDIRTGYAIDHFMSYVKPVIHPKLSTFCTELTGITQAQVDTAPEFPTVVRLFEHWLLTNNLGTIFRFTIVCDSHFDMGKFFYSQCQASGINYRDFGLRWINLKKAYERHYQTKWYKLQVALEQLGMQFEGRLHNGLDDARNIAGILVRMCNHGYVPIQNERIVLLKEEQEQNCNPRVRFALKTVAPISKEQLVKITKRMVQMQNTVCMDSYKENVETPNPPPAPKMVEVEQPATGSQSNKSTNGKTKDSTDLRKKKTKAC